MIIRVFLISILLLLISCGKKKKEATMGIHGHITQSDNGDPVEGADIKLYYKELQGGVFVNSFTLLGSSSTSSSGFYSMNVEKPVSSEYRFTIEKQNYFSREIVVNPDDINKDEFNFIDFELTPSCELNLRLKNTSPVNSSDQIDFQFNTPAISECSECCFSSTLTLIGTGIDTTINCFRTGNQKLTYSYTVTKSGSPSIFIDSIYCPQGSSTLLQINY